MDHFVIAPLLLCSSCFVARLNAEIITTLSVAGSTSLFAAIAGAYFHSPLSCYMGMSECCTSDWIYNDVDGMYKNLTDSVFGQHIALNMIHRSIKAHILNRKRSRKALVLSLHGWTGGGKNYVAQFIANGLYRQGMQSQFVHSFLGTRDFYDPSKLVEYQTAITAKVQAASKGCSQNLFIFDEIDKMPPSLLDSIKSFIDFQDISGGDGKTVTYSQNIFILISNAGGRQITQIAIDAWLAGRSRTDLTERDFESAIVNGVYNEVGGLQNTDVVRRSLIDHYIPFLPLERDHVKKCIQAVEPSLSSKKIESILDSLTYRPIDLQLFSTSGCKKIESKVRYTMVVTTAGYDD